MSADRADRKVSILPIIVIALCAAIAVRCGVAVGIGAASNLYELTETGAPVIIEGDATPMSETPVAKEADEADQADPTQENLIDYSPTPDDYILDADDTEYKAPEDLTQEDIYELAEKNGILEYDDDGTPQIRLAQTS